MAKTGGGLNRWWIVLGSVLGLIVGNGPMMQFTFGIFLKPVAADLGTDRGTLSIAILIGLGLTGIATPFVGSLIDQFGVRRVSLPAIVLFALGFVALAAFASSTAAFIAIYAVMGLFAAGQTPLPYAKALTAAFDRHRGFALGIAMAGVGLGTVIMPQIAQAVITKADWRTAYFVLGVILFVIAVPSMIFLIRDPAHDRDQAMSGTLDGWTGRQTLRTGPFWIFAFAFFVLALACNGVVAHIAPILTDRGVPQQTAASALSLAGLALIVGRIVAGYLLDRIFAPYVAIVFFLLPVAGIALLFAQGSAAAAVAGTVLVGLGLGAEVDLMAFLISRYFGMRSFGQIYGYMFAVFMLASGVGPFLMGITFARAGTYGPALIGMAATLVVAAASLLRLGPYNFRGHGASAGEPHARSNLTAAAGR